MSSERYTYWCHECDMSVSLRPSSSSSSLLCPHCFGNFLELMDSSSVFVSDSPSSFPLSAADDNFLLDSPFLRRLAHHLASSDDFFPNSIPNSSSAAAADTLVSVKIAASLLETDPLMLCAVCKDQFVVDDEAKQLPCKHLYHPDCILPWLANHTTCPVCRFQLPSKPLNPRRSSPSPFRFGDVVAGDEDWFGYGSTLRYIARRHRHILSQGDDDENSSLSSTQMAVAEAEIGLVARTTSLETVSSWPLEAGAGSRELGISGRAIEDAGGDNPTAAGVKVSSSSVS